MDRIIGVKKKIKIFGVIFIVILLIAGIWFGVHCAEVSHFNSEDRYLTDFWSEDNLSVTIEPRGQYSDSWVKTNTLGEHILNGKIYRASISNESVYEVRDWTLRIDITEDCYLNNAWCGTMEIHQFIDGVENVNTLDLRNFTLASIDPLKYYVAGQDLMIPLSEGDYIIYHPSYAEDSDESVIKSTNGEFGGVSGGEFILYTASTEASFTSYRLDYHLYQGYLSGSEAIIYRIFLGILIVFIFVYVVVSSLSLKYEHSLQKKNTILAETLDVLANFADGKDSYTIGHSQRVADCSRLIAKNLGLSESECENVYYIAKVHDIGKCYVPEEILRKPYGLTDLEYEIVKTHTTKGAEMLASFKSISNIADGALYHHERYDGKGYPTGKSGEDIPLVARIIGVADYYDALTSKRVYRDSFFTCDVIAEIEKESGKRFDPVVVEAFKKAVTQMDPKEV